MPVATVTDITKTVIFQQGNCSAHVAVQEKHSTLEIQNSSGRVQITLTTAEMILFAQSILDSYQALLSLLAVQRQRDEYLK